MAPTTQVEMLSTEYHTRLEVYWAFIQGVVALLVQLFVDAAVLLLPGEGLGDFHAVQALVEVGVDVGALVGHILPSAALGGLNQQDNHQKTGGCPP